MKCNIRITILGDVISCCIPVNHASEVVGVACVDIVLEDTLADIKYRNVGESSYVFVITTSGNIVYHPRLPQYSETLIENVECSPEVEEVLTDMKT